MKNELGIKVVTSLFCILLSSLFVIPIASAHTGGGPPFVTVNGELAQTNPYYQGTSSINVPQDVLKTQFLPNENITFSLDPTKLTIPPNIVNQSDFSWVFSSGENFALQTGNIERGRGLTRTFSRPGSYLVSVYLTYQGDSQLLDTIQINILPYKGYSPPTTTVGINQVDKTVSYISNPTIDARSVVKKTLWDIGDGRIIEGSSGKSFSHTYTTANFISFLFNRVIDSNNLITDVGFQTQGINGEISFVPFPNSPSTPFTLTKTKVPTTLFSDSVITAAVSLAVAAFLIFLFLRVRMKKVY